MTKLRLLRMQRGLSQKELASCLGIHPTFLCRLERGWYARCPNWKRLEPKLKRVLNTPVSFEDLMQEVEVDVNLDSAS